MSEKAGNEKQIQFDFSENHQLAGILPISDKITVFAALSLDLDRNSERSNTSTGATAVPTANQPSETDEEVMRKKEEILRKQDNPNAKIEKSELTGEIKTITFICTDNTGKLIWRDSFKSNINKTFINRLQLHDAALGYSYWADSENLYCLYNSIPPNPSASFSVGGTPASQTIIVPQIRTYNLKTGKFHDKPLVINEPTTELIFLTGIMKFPSPRYSFTMSSISKGKFMPLQIFWL